MLRETAPSSGISRRSFPARFPTAPAGPSGQGARPCPLARLNAQPTMNGGVFNAPLAVELPFPRLVELWPPGLEFLMVYVRNTDEIREHAGLAVKTLAPDGVLWFAYPKATGEIRTDITRSSGWAPLEQLGLRPSRHVALDANWAAIRFEEAPLRDSAPTATPSKILSRQRAKTRVPRATRPVSTRVRT